MGLQASNGEQQKAVDDLDAESQDTLRVERGHIGTLLQKPSTKKYEEKKEGQMIEIRFSSFWLRGFGSHHRSETHRSNFFV